MQEDTKEDWEEFYEHLDQEGWHYILTQNVIVPPSLQPMYDNIQFEFRMFTQFAAEEAAKFGVKY